MAVAFLAATESHAGTAGSTSEASFSWVHPATSTVKGVLVYTFTNANSNDATAVSYGSQSMVAVTGGRAVDTTGEPGDCKAWFLSSVAAPSPGGSWSSVSTGATPKFNDINYGGGYWVAVGDTGTIYYRAASNPNGTWTSGSVGSTNNLTSVAYNGTAWMVSGGSSLYYATTPSGTWTEITFSGLSATFNKVRYLNGYWVAVGNSASIYYRSGATPSTSGWSNSSPSLRQKYDIYYSNGYWVIVGNSSQVFYNTLLSGNDWPVVSLTPASGGYRGVRFDSGYWVAVGGDGSIVCRALTPGGIWSAATSGTTSNLRSLACANGYWVTAGAGGVIRYAINPSGVWSEATSNTTTETFHGVAHGDGYWAVAGESSSAAAVTRYTAVPITVTRTNNANEMYAVAITVAADGDTETAGVVLLEGDGILAEQSINDGSPGSNSLRFAGINSGLSGIVTNAASPGANNLSSGANSTWVHDIDFGTRVIGVVRETTAGQGSRSIGFSATTSDDRAAVHLAVRESTPTAIIAGIPIR